MKAKYLFLAIAVLLAAGGLWLARSARRPDRNPANGDIVRPAAEPQSVPKHQPPNPNRKFEKLTPEERVKLARQGPIGG